MADSALQDSGRLGRGTLDRCRTYVWTCCAKLYGARSGDSRPSCVLLRRILSGQSMVAARHDQGRSPIGRFEDGCHDEGRVLYNTDCTYLQVTLIDRQPELKRDAEPKRPRVFVSRRLSRVRSAVSSAASTRQGRAGRRA